MNKSILTFALMVFAVALFAQPNNSYNKNIIMPSPAAATLGKYGDIPVSYYTGVPNIGIPIYTVSDGPLSLPISLSYHASGVRVQEAAGWVGLNWNLASGGAVSRTVQGLKDEDAVGGWYYKGDEIPTLGPTSQDTCNFYNFVPQVNSGVKDSEPDIFSFNVGGMSGKFYLTNNDNATVKVTLVPLQVIKIIPRFSNNTAETNHLRGFIIITPDGVKYHFGDIGDGSPAIETLAGGGGNYPEIPSSWFLKKIETHDGKYAINLSYVDEYSTSTYIPSHSSCDNLGSTFPPAATYGSNVKGKRLSSITTTLETVTFNASTANREDLALHPLGTNPPKSLSSIVISTGAFQKKFEFTYDYWLDHTADAPTTGDITVKKRLRLLNVVEKSGDGTITNPAYVFDYFTQSGNPNFLPHRLSRSIDHWGFYNGKNNGAYNLNTLNIGYQSATCLNGQSCNTQKFSYPGASDRETDEASMKYGTIRKITYPTGGYTEFDFEANDYYSTTPQTNKLTLLNIPAASTCASFTVVGTPNPISFTATDLPNLKYEMTLLSIGCACPAQVSMEVKVYRVSDNALIATSGQYQLNCNQASGTGSVLEGTLQTLFSNQLVANVNYRFEIFFSRSHASFKIIKENTIASGNRKVGGLRIKQVTTHDGYSSTNNIVRTYEYRDSVQTTRSSGILYQEPKYFHSYSWYPDTLAVCIECSPDCACNPTGGCSINFFDISSVPLSSFEGYHIGYSYVKEIYPSNGYKTYAFQTESPVSNTTFPAPPAPARIIAGNLRYSAVRDNSSNLKASETHVPFTEAYTTSTATMFKVSQQCGSFLTTYSIRTRPYREVSVANMLDGISNAVVRTFDPTNRFYFPVTEKTYNSDGKEFLTEYTYSHDYNTSTTIRDSLLAKFIIGTPWKTSVKVNGVQFDGAELEFAFFNNTTGAYQTSGAGASPRPYKYYRFEKTWNTSGTLTGTGKTLKGTTNSYDAKGNETSFTEAGWTDPETYVWNTAGLLLSKTYKSHTVTYEYYTNTRLAKIVTDIDGRKTGYTYDNLMRLAKMTKDNASLDGSGNVVNGNVRSEYTYHYKEPSPGDQYNWIKVKNTFTTVSGSNLTSTETIEYLDGIGRGMQTVKKAWSPTSKDVVSAVAYDSEGRVVRQYTPFMTTTNTGAFATVPVNQKYSLIAYEASPLGRTTSATAPDWYAVTSSYGTNAANEVGYMNGTSATSYFPANSLVKTTIVSPQSATVNIETITWKDKKGRVVLSRTKQAGSSTNIADTYTLYDDKNRVAKVLPPGVGTGAGDAGLRFEYTYDQADRMTSKKVPDQAIINMRYDQRDQLVLMQDGNQAAAGKWFLSKYDDYGRILSSGLHTGTNPDPNNAGSLAFSEQHIANTYGSSGINLGKLVSMQTWQPGGSSVTRSYTYSTVTGRLLTDNGGNHLSSNTGSDNYTYTYDYAGNMLKETRAHKTSSSSSTLTLETRYTFDHAGRKTGLFHKINTAAEKQLATYSYDFRDRLLEKNLNPQYVGDDLTYLQSIDFGYNEQNWLTSINGPSSFAGLSQEAIALCSTNPVIPNPAEGSYLDADANDLFKLDLYYDTPGFAFGSSTGQRNGNISQVVWQTRGRQRQGYSLQYDYLNRLTTAYYADINSSGTATTDNKYQENLTYADARGNIASMTRNGLYKTTGAATCWTLGQIDNLAYTYNTGTNRLQKIADTAPTGGTGNPQRNTGFNPGTASGTATYGYDANGNMNSDPYKGITLTYNHLNLPTQFNFGSGKTIDILYDYTGKKLRKTVKPTSSSTDYTQDYVKGLEYRTTGSGGTLTLEAIYTDEGRITPNGAAYRYEYTINDHLGNARISFADLNGNNVVDVPSDILQENHYYPFGMNMNYGWMNDAGLLDSRYQYNDKELNGDFGLNLSDYGARWYDASLGRWQNVDPMAEGLAALTSYNYVTNNPMILIDPSGMFPGQMNEAYEMQKQYDQDQRYLDYLASVTQAFILGEGSASKDPSTVHLIPLKGVDQETVEKTKTILEAAASAAGLNVNFSIGDPKTFDITSMPVTDAVAVIGATKSQAADYILANFDKGYLAEDFKVAVDGMSFRKSTAGFYPETSSRGAGGWGYVIATSIENDPRVGSTYKTAHAAFGCGSLYELVALNVFHGMGHNSGISHAGFGFYGGDRGFMHEGVLLEIYMRESGGLINAVVRTKNEYPEVLKSFSKRFN